MDYNWILLRGMRYYMETIKIQHLFGRFSIFFLVLIVAVFAEEYSINRLCLNINGFPFIFMNAFMIVGIAYIYQKATRKLFIKQFEYEIYEDFFYIDGNKYEYQDVIKCEIHYFDYFFINVLCLHIDMKNTSKSTILLYSEDLDEGIDCKDIQLFKFYESVSKHLRIS